MKGPSIGQQPGNMVGGDNQVVNSSVGTVSSSIKKASMVSK